MFNPNISNTDNYIKNNDYTIDDIFKKYVKLIEDLLILIKNQTFTSNVKYEKYIIINGIKSITHIFSILFLYTFNIDLTIYHVNRAFIYYIEFIGQIGDNNQTFLQLSSKDASMFIYKKTIFEIDEIHKKNIKFTNEHNIFLNKLNMLITLYNNLLYNFINTNKDNNIVSKWKQLSKKFISTDINNLHEYYNIINIIFDRLKNVLPSDRLISLILLINKNFCINNTHITINNNLLKLLSDYNIDNLSNQRISNIILRD